MNTAEARVPAIEISTNARRRLQTPAWLPWAPVLLFLIAIAVLYPLKLDTPHEISFLMPLVNSTVFVLVALVAAFLAGWSFSEDGALSLMFLGVGVLVFGLGTLVSPGLRGSFGPNAAATVHDIATAVAGICHVLSAVFVWRSVRVGKYRGPLLFASYLFSAVLVMCVTLIAMRGLIPAFTDARHATELRQVVLWASIALYLAAATIFGLRSRATEAPFLAWYSLGLGLICVRLFAISISVADSPISWVGRLAEAVGQIYILFCLVLALRNSDETTAGPAIARTFRQMEEALRKSVEQYDFLFTVANDGIILYEPAFDGSACKIVRVNEGLARLVGCDVDSSSLRDILGPLIVKAHEAAPDGMLESAAIHTCDGRDLPVEVSVREFDHDGRPRALAIVRDLSSRYASQLALERESATAQAINRILHAALVSDTENEIGSECLAVAEELTNSPFSFIAQVSSDGTLHNVAMSWKGWAKSVMEGYQAELQRPLPKGHVQLYREVLSHGASVRTNHPDETPAPEHPSARHPSITSFLGTPLWSGEQVVGVIGVANREGGYSQLEQEALEAIAPSMVEALERFRAEKALAESARFAYELTDIEAVIHSSLDFHKTAHKALESGARVLGASSCSISLCEPPYFRVAYAYGYTDQVEGLLVRQSDEEHGLLAVRTEKPVVVSDAMTDSRIDERHVSTLGVKAVVVVPLLINGAAVGFINYNFSEPRDFTDVELNFVERMSSSLGLAMENARLFDSERQIARTHRALSRVDRSIHSSLDQTEILSRMVVESAGAIDADSIVLAMKEGECWVVRHGYNVPPRMIGRVFFEDSVPQIALAVEQGEPIAIDNTQHKPLAGNVAHMAMGVQALLVAPVFVRGEASAVVFFNYNRPRRFTLHERRYAAGLAKSVGLAMANAKLYETERRIAETLQETLLVVPSHVPGVAFSRSYETATIEQARVGGDFVDIFEVHGNLVGIAIGDVSGKGIDAAVTTALVRNTLRVHAVDGLSPSMVCNKTNQVVRKFTSVEAFVTVFFGLLNTKTGLLRYVCAGHPPGLIFGDGSDIRRLMCPDPILGAFEDVTFSESSTILGPGDRMIVYSDGVTEARSPEGSFLDMDGLLALIEQHGHEPTTSFCERIMEEVLEFSAGELRDDAALLVVEPTRIKVPALRQPQLDLN